MPGLNISLDRIMPGLNISLDRIIPGLNIALDRIMTGLNISLDRILQQDLLCFTANQKLTNLTMQCRRRWNVSSLIGMLVGRLNIAFLWRCG